jgi:TRAP transporter 4TM/12TM fusion protein
MPVADIPHFWSTFIGGLHFLIPIIVLIYLLMVERWSASSAVFYSILWMMVIILTLRVRPGYVNQFGLIVLVSVPVLISTAMRWGLDFDPITATVWGLGSAGLLVVGLAAMSARNDPFAVLKGLKTGFGEIATGMIAGARNMISIGVAVAAAGIIVGSVSSTGLNNAMVGLVETISGGNVYILLIFTAVLCIVLGMGLPTTANYIVVASLLAGVVVELGQASGLVLPLIAVHLFVFYFGLMADSTPPVCLAAFAAAAISRADPLETGVQSFFYDIRTAVLPFIFIFNPELLLIGVETWWHGLMVFVFAVIAIFCFSAATQGWFLIKLKWYEIIALLVVMFALFRPDFMVNLVYPKFVPVALEKLAASEKVATPGYTVRLHVTRQTDYGDRLKLYRIGTTSLAPDKVFGDYGLKLKRTDKGTYEVVELQRLGLAAKIGVKEGDFISEIDVEQVGLPSKRWAYPFALAALGMIILWQLYRRRRQAAAA